jgi:ABC-2 type transport system permease protein/oleandomycin transport system permease protein
MTTTLTGPAGPATSPMKTPTAGARARRKATMWSDSLVVAKRNLIRMVRTPQLIFFNSVQPVMFVLLFRYVFGGAINTGGAYVNYLIPGILVQTSLFGGAGTALGLSEDMSKGIVDRFRSLPMARSAVLTGRVVADVVRNLFVILLMIVVGVLVGFRFNNGFLPSIGAIALLALFGMAFCWMFALIGLSVRDPESAQIASFLPVFPLTFAASTFVPLSSMPTWLQAFARNQPVSHAVNAVRSLTQGDIPGVNLANEFVLTLVWSAGIALAFSLLAVRKYRRAS